MWNAEHASIDRVVLLPILWETHARPESGRRPQSALNHQLVRDCDLLIGMFWTKLGTKTGIADSGTVEEVDSVVSAGKPAMLYPGEQSTPTTSIRSNRRNCAPSKRLRKGRR